MNSETQIEANLETIVATAARILEERGDNRLSTLLYQSKVEIGSVRYDNWDGGTEYVKINLYAPISLYAELKDEREECESAINGILTDITRDIEKEHIDNVRILPLSVDLSTAANFTLHRLGNGVTVKTAFDEYVIEHLIGQGGNGRVFAARDGDGHECALKFIDKDSSISKYKRFKNEICFCETIKHKNIVSILDRGLVIVGGREYAFYVMPRYYKTLRDKMKEGLSPVEAIGIFIGVLNGLNEAHRHKAIHRDIKPENILFAKDSDVPVICDFGIAHIPREDMATTVVTKPSDKMANAVYKAPEQNPGKGGATFQSDVYAVGLILNEMFTGEVPASGDYTRISSVVPEFAFLDEIVSSLYRQNPKDRLYPVDKILQDLGVRARIAKLNEAENAIKSKVAPTSMPPIDTLKVVSKSYEDRKLLFVFNVPIPEDWLSIMKRGVFSHRSLLGYDANNVVRVNENTLALPAPRIGDIRNVSTIVGNFNEWVSAVNAKYHESILEWHRRMQREEERNREEEILRLKQEKEIQEALLKM